MTKTEIQALILEIDTAISHILKGGQEYTITSASGSARTFKGAEISTLINWKNQLESQLAGKNNTKAVKLQAGW